MNNLLFLACGVISTVLGMIWFGPLFGKQYRKYCGVTPEMERAIRNDPKAKTQMMKSAAIAFVASVFMAYMLSGLIETGQIFYHVSNLAAAVAVPIFMWFGFVVPPTLGMVLWENKKWGHWFLVASFWLVYMVLAGCLIVYA